jgi:hypothetical protein
LRSRRAKVWHFATGVAFCYSVLLHYLWCQRKSLWHKGLRQKRRAYVDLSPYAARV